MCFPYTRLQALLVEKFSFPREACFFQGRSKRPPPWPLWASHVRAQQAWVISLSVLGAGRNAELGGPQGTFILRGQFMPTTPASLSQKGSCPRSSRKEIWITVLDKVVRSAELLGDGQGNTEQAVEAISTSCSRGTGTKNSSSQHFFLAST